MKIIADRAIPFIQHFCSSLGDLNLVDGRDINADAVRDADVLIVRTVTKVNEQLLKDSNVRFVASATSGIDHVDTEYLEQRNIGFAYAPGCNARSVAEYVLSSLFALADQYEVNLAEKRVGIIGYGQVGSQLDAFLQACGITTIVNDPPLQEKTGEKHFLPLEEVLQADIVSLHVPFNKVGSHPTHHLLNSGSMKHLKQDVILVNTSRGGVVDEDALLQFKHNNKQAHLVLDVWENEPRINDTLVLLTEINTSHIAGYSTDGKLRATETICRRLCDHFDIRTDSISVPVLPERELAEINLSDYANELEAVQLAVLTAYDARSDSASLQRILEISEHERAAFFHELRNNYPVRREFSSLRVNVPATTESLMTMLSKLGFAVDRVFM